MDRETYRTLIAAVWLAAAHLDTLSLMRLEIAARRRGTREELCAVAALRRAMDELRDCRPDKRSL